LVHFWPFLKRIALIFHAAGAVTKNWLEPKIKIKPLIKLGLPKSLIERNLLKYLLKSKLGHLSLFSTYLD